MTASDEVRLRHDAKVRMVLRSGDEVLEDWTTEARLINATFTRWAIVYNRRAGSGGVSWWHPATGNDIKRPQVRVEWVDPDGILGVGELCDCPICVAEASAGRSAGMG